ncbi:uncharacterized protein ACA1_155680 [Acanthamoeba castellanii str. Neff]|uniref:Uncharacterized protein n=1 Tax=Acanthamoeba castellanii (strain ATCC 30010 / Neff) TaxID=1257118 RepID=L8H2M5_ACACF|nr:uncharacterized protein ACA1_155680 [Acanthamoeba castellanii str. Neff]ELR18611.1 hypothetical protein ACA1_155680 [Acanthamoeba castellanii str. Neff]
MYCPTTTDPHSSRDGASSYLYGKVAGLATEVGRLSLVLQGTAHSQAEVRTSMQQQLYRSMSLLDVHTRQLQELLAGPTNVVVDDDEDALSALEGRKTKKLFTDRMCADCCTQFTSQWRSGPLGPSTYCRKRKREHRLREDRGQGGWQGLQRTSISYLLN